MSSFSPANSLDPQLGLATDTVRLVPYNADWPVVFEQEQLRIASLLKDLSPAIEHIGSTAVPGLDAKPVLDIMVGVDGVEQMFVSESMLVLGGYEAKGEKGIPGRLFLTYGCPTIFHVHLTEVHSVFWHEHILFRDQLRQQKQVAKNYVEIKSQLADMFPNDRDSYTRGKAGFIEEVLNNARQLYSPSDN